MLHIACCVDSTNIYIYIYPSDLLIVFWSLTRAGSTSRNFRIFHEPFGYDLSMWCTFQFQASNLTGQWLLPAQMKATVGESVLVLC